MPPADVALSSGAGLLRVLCYGKGKSKKTWWALQCAELGLNPILLDGDDGWHIVNQIKEEYRKRITIMDLVDKEKQATFAIFMAMFLRPGNAFTWNEQRKEVTHNASNYPANSHVVVDRSKLTNRDVLILDSWTELCGSSRNRYAEENTIDQFDATKTDWDGYGFEGRFLDFVLNQAHSLPCHLIVIGHEQVYEKRAKDGKTIISQTTRPSSSSANHAAKLAKHFSDILYFSQISSERFQIDTSGDQSRDGGSRLLAPMSVKWEDLHPRVLFEKLNTLNAIDLMGQGRMDLTSEVLGSPAFRYYAPGEVPAGTPNQLINKPIQAQPNVHPISAGIVATAVNKPNPFAKK